MAKRGPKPKVSAKTPVPLRGIPDCPQHLNPVAKDVWFRVTKALDELGILSTTDADNLELYCVVWSRWRQAEAKVQETGLLIEVGEKGYEIQNPYLNIANAAIKQLNTLMNNMGLTPAARAKVNAATKEDSSAAKWKDLI